MNKIDAIYISFVLILISIVVFQNITFHEKLSFTAYELSEYKEKYEDLLAYVEVMNSGEKNNIEISKEVRNLTKAFNNLRLGINGVITECKKE